MTDPRLQNLSYSSILTLHSCPRKFQLEKSKAVAESNESPTDSITFSYGHCVGLGIQLTLEGKTPDEVMWRLFLEWNCDLWAENPKQNKSFAAAVYAVQKFSAMLAQGYLSEYELLYHEDKPACELSFLINLPDGYKYRGFVDAVLRHKVTGKIIVLEVKTSSAATVNPATYKNSAQAIGYSIVLDVLAPEISAYDVIYLVYNTKTMSYEQLVFSKSYVQRARWIRELVLDVGILSSYVEHDLFPMHGESCFTYFRECDYMGLCQMSDSQLIVSPTPEDITKLEAANAQYQITISLEDLITHQLSKASS